MSIARPPSWLGWREHPDEPDQTVDPGTIDAPGTAEYTARSAMSDPRMRLEKALAQVVQAIMDIAAEGAQDQHQQVRSLLNQERSLMRAKAAAPDPRELPTLIGFRMVAALIGRAADRTSRVYLWRAVRAGTFPAPIKVSESRIAWRRSEVESWIASRPRVNYSHEPDDE